MSMLVDEFNESQAVKDKNNDNNEKAALGDDPLWQENATDPEDLPPEDWINMCKPGGDNQYNLGGDGRDKDDILDDDYGINKNDQD